MNGTMFFKHLARIRIFDLWIVTFTCNGCALILANGSFIPGILCCIITLVGIIIALTRIKSVTTRDFLIMAINDKVYTYAVVITIALLLVRSFIPPHTREVLSVIMLIAGSIMLLLLIIRSFLLFVTPHRK